MKKYLIGIACAALAAAGAQAQRIAVLSDIHVIPGNETDRQLRLAVEEINRGGFDYAVVNGDLTNEGSDEQIANVKSILDGITVPLAVLPGNHENNWSQSATKTFVDTWGNDRFLDFGRGGQSFRIVTPLAAEGTALEKHGRPDAGTVVNGKFLDVENTSALHRRYLVSVVDEFIIPISGGNFK